MRGHCLCKSVSFEAPDRTEVEVCHCTMCRRWGGPAFVVGFEGKELTFEGREHIRSYASSDWAERGFCQTCGTHLFYRFVQDDLYTLHTGLFEGDPTFEITKQIFVDEQPQWYALANDTPTLTGQEVFDAYAQSQS